MVVFQSSKPLQTSIPDDLTVPQFIFGCSHELRPYRQHDVPWLIEDETGRRIGEGELYRRTQGLAHALKSLFRIGEDEVVLIFSRNHVDYPVAIWAVHQLGAIISGANPDFSKNELLSQLKETKACLMIVHPDTLETSLAAAKESGLPSERIICFDTPNTPKTYSSLEGLVQHGLKNPDPTKGERTLRPGEAKTKLAFLSFSSGTTGKPKAVAITHYGLIANVIQLAAHNNINNNYREWNDQRIRAGDVAIGVLPFFHIYGLSVNLHFIIFCAVFAKMSLVVIPKFNFEEMLKSIIRHRITHLLLVPPQAVLLCKHPAMKKYDIRPYVRFLMCGAAPLSHELNQQVIELFPNAHVGQGSGMTETCGVTHLWSIGRKRGIPGSVGQLLPGMQARIIKPDGSLAGYGESGELYVKTPSAAIGYFNNSKATEETFIDGWIRTGDGAKVDEEGEFWMLDRLKEIMKVKGFQVAPAELEGCILEHEDVFAACVIGIPDEYCGEVPLAFVVLKPDAQRRVQEDAAAAMHIKASIKKHVANNKVHFKELAGGVEFTDAIPVTPSGKLLRRVLRARGRELRAKAKAKL